MRKEILKSKMMMIALASILFVSCGGGGGGGGGGSSNLPINPGTPSVPKPSTPSTPSNPEDSFPTVTNPLDSQKGNMSALKASLYTAQKNSGVAIPKDTTEIDGSGVKVAILDANFVNAVRSGASSAEDEKGNAINRRRDKTLTDVYTDVDIIDESPNHPYIKEAVSGTEKQTGLEHGEEVLEVVRDLEWAPNSFAFTDFPDNKPKNKIKTILGTVGWDYTYVESGQNKNRVAAILPTQEVYEAAMAKFGNQSVKIFNQSFGSKDSYDDSKYRSYRGEGNLPLPFAKMHSSDSTNFMILKMQ